MLRFRLDNIQSVCSHLSFSPLSISWCCCCCCSSLSFKFKLERSAAFPIGNMQCANRARIPPRSLPLSASLPPYLLLPLCASPPRRSFACFGLTHTDPHTYATRKPAAYVSHVKRQRTSFTLRAALITTQLSTATATATLRFVPRRVFFALSLSCSLSLSCRFQLSIIIWSCYLFWKTSVWFWIYHARICYKKTNKNKYHKWGQNPR